VNALLDVRDLSVHFVGHESRIRAVDHVSFSIGHGETLGIVGESGCGKSVTALSVMGLLPETAAIVGGSISFDGALVTGKNTHTVARIRGRDVGMIFQDPSTSLHPTLTIGSQIGAVLQRHLGLSKAQARTRAAELLAEVGIPRSADRLKDYPYQLSGGMQQRVMIAIAISCNPRLLIADEPTTALDVTIQAGVLELLDELQARHGLAIVLITHDMGVIAQMAQQVLVMYAGQIVEQASAEELFEHPEHPYTEALLGAIPNMADPDIRHRRLAAIAGRPPVVVDPATGCRFAPRCPYGADAGVCSGSPQDLREIRRDHWVRSAHPRSERESARGAASSVDGSVG
jgi:oligopeptide transport system ATP-binding protein